MVDTWTGTWVPEENYDNYPEEEMCDMDRLYIRLKETYPNYEPKTSWERICEFIFWMFVDQASTYGYDSESIEDCWEWFSLSGTNTDAIAEFDLE